MKEPGLVPVNKWIPIHRQTGVLSLVLGPYYVVSVKLRTVVGKVII